MNIIFGAGFYVGNPILLAKLGECGVVDGSNVGSSRNSRSSSNSWNSSSSNSWNSSSSNSWNSSSNVISVALAVRVASWVKKFWWWLACVAFYYCVHKADPSFPLRCSTSCLSWACAVGRGRCVGVMRAGRLRTLRVWGVLCRGRRCGERCGATRTGLVGRA
jgi:hypothetical protein